ncbi:MAG TPA: PH domain-containing protein [Steroidobacteraceae bacterium]|nr:PH domain-containing protein [Steroidobacteraceae bacterium]
MTVIEFGAPWSAGVRTASMLSTAILALGMLAAILAPPLRLTSPLGLLLIGLPLLILVIALIYRVRGYTLTEDAISVQRGVGEIRLPLTGLRSVTGDVDAMRGSLRVFGNGGFFAITGRYWNRKLGWYRAFATDPSRAVVLRYASRTIVITPHDPQHFIMRARTFLKVADFPK